MKKISIIGATFTGNRGAEAMLCSVVNKTAEKYPDAEFYIFSYYPSVDRKLLQESSHHLKEQIKIFSSTPFYISAVLFPAALIYAVVSFLHLKFLTKLLPASVRALGDSDVLIDIAGVSFMSGRAVFLPFNILTILPAMLVKTPVVKFAQGLGPFTDKSVRIAASLFLPKCRRVFARGEITLKYLHEFFGNKDFIGSAADSAFMHQKGYSITDENSGYVKELCGKIQKQKKSGQKILGFCPSSVVYKKTQKQNIDYVSVISDIISKLLKDNNNTLLLFPNATRKESGEKLRNNDLVIIKLIKKKLESAENISERVIYVENDINTDSIKSLIELCDITVVSRFHAMIASLTLEVPPLVLGWSHKYLEVMKQFGMEDAVLDYLDIKNDTAGKIADALKNCSKLSGKISEYLPTVKKESAKQYEYVFKELLK